MHIPEFKRLLEDKAIGGELSLSARQTNESGAGALQLGFTRHASNLEEKLLRSGYKLPPANAQADLLGAVLGGIEVYHHPEMKVDIFTQKNIGGGFTISTGNLRQTLASLVTELKRDFKMTKIKGNSQWEYIYKIQR